MHLAVYLYLFVSYRYLHPTYTSCVFMCSGQKWDRSHLLENLSGYETSCSMIGSEDWPFTQARRIAANYGIRITAVYGSAVNEGSTDLAVDKIVENFKQVSTII